MKPQVLILSLLTAGGLVAAITACTLAAMRHRGDPENGRYLVEKVGLCSDCHSPRDEQGKFVRERWLQGAPILFTPTIPMPWAPASKPLAGLPTLTDEQAMTFLTTGVLPGGRTPLPPMPPYRFAEQDARDVIAYLRHPVLPDADPLAAADGAPR